MTFVRAGSWQHLLNGKSQIHSSRYQGKYDGKIGAIATEPSNLGLKVDVGGETPVFFLKDEVALLN